MIEREAGTASAVLQEARGIDEVDRPLPIVAVCSMCHRVRNNTGEYVAQTEYQLHNCEFSHTLCPDCLSLYYSSL